MTMPPPLPATIPCHLTFRYWRHRGCLLLGSLAIALITGCSGNDTATYVEEPVEKLYNEAADLLEKENYEQAASRFDEVDRQHPYSKWATKAQLMSSYALFQRAKYDDAIFALKRYIQLHPTSPDVAYAHYLLALCYYEQISDVKRDQNMTVQALRELEGVVNRFPDTEYARDAEVKIELTVDHMAGKEMDIGRGYQRRGQHLAAINRFRNVVDHFQTTTHVPEALHRLTESYLALGMIDEAQKSAAVLGHNFPGSEWYIDSYQIVEQVDIRPPKEKPWYKIW